RRPPDLHRHPLRSHHAQPHGSPRGGPELRLPNTHPRRRAVPQNPHLLPHRRPQNAKHRLRPTLPTPTRAIASAFSDVASRVVIPEGNLRFAFRSSQTTTTPSPSRRTASPSVAKAETTRH